MDFNIITNLQTCYEYISSNPTTVTLVLYTHLPSILISSIIGILVLAKNRELLGKILFGITTLFSLWALFDLIIWLSTNSSNIITAWSFLPMTMAMIAAMSFYFFYVFLFKKDLSFTKKILLFIPLLPILILTPTTYNLVHFDY